MTTKKATIKKQTIQHNKLVSGNYYRVLLESGSEILYYNDDELFSAGTELPTPWAIVIDIDYDPVAIGIEDFYNRHDFMKMYRAMPEAIGEQLNHDLTPDDRLEIFSGIMLGESDFSVDLFNQILADYGVSWSVDRVENEIKSKDVKADEMFQVTLTQDVKVEQIKDWLITALEGGSNYWYWIDEKEVDKAEKYCKMVKFDKYPSLTERLFYAIKNGIEIEIQDKESNEVLGKLKWDNLYDTFENLNREYPYTWNNLVVDEYDAGDADIFLQFWLMEEVIYG